MSNSFSNSGVNRRQFLAASAATAVATSVAGGMPKGDRISGQAEHVISIWLGGGMGQIDTFDPKAKGDPQERKRGAYYDAIPTCVEGVQVCEHLSKLAPIMDRVTAVRTVNHSVIDEHAAATNWMHVGRPVSGTVVYPSLGSIVAHERGAASDEVPAYVLIGYPNATRGPGFLGAQHSYLYLTETGRGPAGLSPPLGVDRERQMRREHFLTKLRSLQPETRESALRDYEATMDLV